MITLLAFASKGIADDRSGQATHRGDKADRHQGVQGREDQSEKHASHSGATRDPAVGDHFVELILTEVEALETLHQGLLRRGLLSRLRRLCRSLC